MLSYLHDAVIIFLLDVFIGMYTVDVVTILIYKLCNALTFYYVEFSISLNFIYNSNYNDF